MWWRLIGLIIVLLAPPSAAQPLSGWWWNPGEGGRGYSIEYNAADGSIFFGAYLYDATGRPIWYVANLVPAGTDGAYGGALNAFRNGQTLSGAYHTAQGQSSNGFVSLTFSSAQSAQLSLVALGVAPTNVPIQRFSFGSGSAPGGSLPQTGWWWNANEGGRGYFLETQGNQLLMAAYMYDSDGTPIWFLTQNAMNGGAYNGAFTQYGNGQSLGASYRAPAITNGNVGAVTLAFSSATAATMTLPNGVRIPLQRYTFSNPRRALADIRIAGPPVIIFDHLTMKQEPYNIPDAQATAWRGADGMVNFTVPHFEEYRMRGPDLAHLTMDTAKIYSSTSQASDIAEAHYDYHHWFTTPYTFDGVTIVTLTHSEWYACLLNNDCDAGDGVQTATSSGDYSANSWANRLCLLISRDQGASWTLDGANFSQVVADRAFFWTGSQPYAHAIYRRALNHTGLFGPSRLVREGGNFYTIASYLHRDFTMIDPNTLQAPVDADGFVLLRTSDPTNPVQWQAWANGTNFVPVTSGPLGTFLPMQADGSAINAGSQQLIYDTASRLYIMIFAVFGGDGTLYYVTSPSLNNPNWSTARPLLGSTNYKPDPRGPTDPCNTGFQPGHYPSLIDPLSEGLNFEFTHGAPWLVYAVNPANCSGDNLARDTYRAQLVIDYH